MHGQAQPAPSGHPKGLWVLFITEMWERFSYYGMRALLVLYLIASTDELLPDGGQNWNPGFGWDEASAYELYGYYTSAVYITPLVGGWLADKFLGTHRSMLIGGWIIAAGHITLAGTELFGITPGSVVSMQASAGSLICFVGGLVLIVVGTGFFKPCVSVMVGQLYAEGDPRRDSGFTIFYMGINLGALLSPLVAGTLGEKVGWHWGFGAAAVGMIMGLICYQFLRPKYLAGIGLPPSHDAAKEAGRDPTPEELEAARVDAHEATRPLTSVDFQRLVVIVVLAILGNIMFWAFFEQAGTTLNVFAAENTDRTIFGTAFPATWYQAVNPLAIVVFAPVFSWLWVKLNAMEKNPSTPMKFAWGQWLLGLSFIAMIFGSMQAQDGGMAGPHWLFITFVVVTWGELCLSPVGLSMVTKLAPKRLQALMMGIWFLSLAGANFVGAQVAVLSRAFLPGEGGAPAEHTFVFPGLPGFFLLLVLLPLVGGVVITALSPFLRKWMHGVH
ncbi:MAG: peptide MFS transporter [Deltaproteobacteria bacterium]